MSQIFYGIISIILGVLIFWLNTKNKINENRSTERSNKFGLYTGAIGFIIMGIALILDKLGVY
jgi:H+/Cl- antiporter ClcA